MKRTVEKVYISSTRPRASRDVFSGSTINGSTGASKAPDDIEKTATRQINGRFSFPFCRIHHFFSLNE
jgi:hypothetical protein